MAKKIYIKYHDETLERCKKIDVGAWIDLRAAETVEMKAGEYREISLGVSMRIPSGYEAIIAPRSSTYKRWGIIESNSIGVVDPGYCGDQDIWKFPAIAMRDTIISKGDRICQFRIMKNQPKIKFVEMFYLGYKNRGGFGSTGSV
jgi:dUTP pyrophosphatase